VVVRRVLSRIFGLKIGEIVRAEEMCTLVNLTICTYARCLLNDHIEDETDGECNR
jgi:hypothetical protein